MVMLSPASGEVVQSLGPYELRGVLGEGGMGVVYAAVHSQTGEPAAVKTVKVRHEHQLAGIRREILALSRIKHPGVVQVLAAGLNESVPWYAMERLEGETLSSLRDRGFEMSGSRTRSSDPTPNSFLPRLPSAPDQPTLAGEDTPMPAPRQSLYGPAAGGKLREALTVLRRLCSTLAYLHGEGIVHRDLKPSNIFVRPGLRPVLVDFGLVWRSDSTGREVLDVGLNEAGTVGYMAPELFRGEFSDARADLYAFGCILFEMLTGRLPFEGSSIMQIRSGHLALTPTPPSHLVDGVPPELDQLVLGLLEKQARHRIGHASDVAMVLAALGADADQAPPSAPPRAYVYRPALAGREQALGRLGEVLDRSCRSEGAMVLVGGESGVGKTYLAMAFARQAMARGFTVVTGSCTPGNAHDDQAGAPLQPFRRLLQCIADRCVEMGPAATATLLGPNVHLLAPYEPSLADLPGSESFPPPPELAAQAARARLVAAVQGAIASFASLTPLLLIIDDVQWLDDLSAQVLRGLDPAVFRSKLLLLGTLRTEEPSAAVEALKGHPRAIELPLDRLDEATVGALVGDMLAVDRPPSALVHFLTLRCKGNPFFVAEYLRAAVTEGLLTRVNGRWTILDQSSDTVSIPLPSTLGALVLHRLGGLSPSARAALEGAAVLGKEMSLGLLEQLVEGQGEAWLATLRELLRAQVIEEGGEGQVRFLHDKLREVAYEAIPAARRPALHLRAATLLEAAGGVDPRALAAHFLAGQDHLRAIDYLELAGEAALRTFSNREAVECFEQALVIDRQSSAAQPASWERALAASLVEREASEPAASHRRPRLLRSAPSPTRRAAALRRARWLRGVSEAQFALGDLNACLDAGSQALRHLGYAPPTTTRGWAADLLRQASTQLSYRLGLRERSEGEPFERATLSEAALLMQRLSERFYYHFDALPMLATSLASVNYAERAESDLRVARPYGMLGMTVGISKLESLGVRYFQLARGVAERTDDRDGLAFCLYAEAGWRIGNGQWERVRALSQQALDIASARGSFQDIAISQTLLAHIAYYTGHFQESFDRFQDVGSTGLRGGNQQHRAWGLYAGARALVRLGERERALAMLREADVLLEPLADAPSKIICSGLLAMTHLHLDDLPAAVSAARVCSERIHQSLPTVFSTSDAYAAAAEVFLEQWERDPASSKEARRAVFDLLTLAFNIPIGWPAYHRLKGRELWQLGQHSRARASWAKGLERARTLAMPYEEGLALLSLGRAAPAASSERRRLLDEAARLFERMRCPDELADSRAALSP